MYVVFAEWNETLNIQILQACKELVDDAKMGCADLVFKEVCLEILSRSRHVLTDKQFRQLVAYTSEKMREKIPFEIEQKFIVNK
jgi:hypothetical protein